MEVTNETATGFFNLQFYTKSAVLNRAVLTKLMCCSKLQYIVSGLFVQKIIEWEQPHIAKISKVTTKLTLLYIFYLLLVSHHQILQYGNSRNGYHLGWDEIQLNVWCYLFPALSPKCHHSSVFVMKALCSSNVFFEKPCQRLESESTVIP